MTIVVVDDEPSIVQMCVRVLQAQGHTVHGFSRAPEALARLGGEPVDLLVVDYKMPGVDGLELIQRARAIRPGLRVLMITAHGTREVIGRATRSGVHDVVLKPFTPAELTSGVAAALQRAVKPSAG